MIIVSSANYKIFALKLCILNKSTVPRDTLLFSDTLSHKLHSILYSGINCVDISILFLDNNNCEYVQPKIIYTLCRMLA